jgi:hypothetical protein
VRRSSGDFVFNDPQILEQLWIEFLRDLQEGFVSLFGTAAVSESKITVRIELEGSGEIVETLADAPREFFKAARPSVKPVLPRFEDTPPAVSISPRLRIRRSNGHHHAE